MKFKVILFCFLAVCFSVISGAEKNVFTIRIPEKEQKHTPEIKTDISNIIREPDRADIRLRKPKQGTLASVLGMPSCRIIWTPAFAPGSLNRIRVYEKVMSDDRSVLFFAEETGNQPFGTRIIAYDPLNLRCFRITELPFRMAHIAPVSASGVLVGVRLPQEELEDRLSLVTVDLKKNRLLSSFPINREPEELAPVSSGRIFCRMKDSSVMLMEKGKLKKCSVEGRVLHLKAYGSLLVAVRADCVDLYRAAGEPKKIKRYPVSGVICAMIASPKENSLYLLVRNQDDSCTILSVSGQGIRTVVRKCGDQFAYSPESNAIFYFKDRRNRDIVRLDLKTGKTSRNAGRIDSLPPKTSGIMDSFYPAPAADELVFVNVIGRPYRICCRKGVWKKELDE